MGAHLVSLALARWTHVSDRAFRVLIRMAVTALDNPGKGQPAGIYHGGRELLAMSLRGEKGSADTKYRAVKRAVAELTEAGAIEHLATGWAGQNAVYRLTLNRSGSAVEPTEMGGLIDPPMGGPMSPPMGGRSGSERGVVETPPRNQEELLHEREQEEAVDLPTTSRPPRATRADGKTAEVIDMFNPTGDRCSRVRAQAKAELAAKAERTRENLARREAARQAHREAT